MEPLFLNDCTDSFDHGAGETTQSVWEILKSSKTTPEISFNQKNNEENAILNNRLLLWVLTSSHNYNENGATQQKR